METRVALIGIIVEQESSAAALNALLHEYGGYIIGRMGPAVPGAGRKHHLCGAGRTPG